MGVKSTGSHPTTTQADGHLLEYFRQTFGGGGGGTNAPPGASGLTATGGVISDYTSGPAIYRAHIFTSSGTFSVTDIGDFPAEVDYLVIGGGGAGGYNAGGGGGAGAFRTSIPGHPLAQPSITVSTSPGSYTVTIGAGGAGGIPQSPNRGGSGGDSVFGPITSPGGGGGGGTSPPSHRPGVDGGSGGGGGMGLGGGSGAYPGSPNPNPFRMGYDGGTGTDNGFLTISLLAVAVVLVVLVKMELHQMVLAVMAVMDHRLQSKVQLLNFMPVVALEVLKTVVEMVDQVAVDVVVTEHPGMG